MMQTTIARADLHQGLDNIAPSLATFADRRDVHWVGLVKPMNVVDGGRP